MTDVAATALAVAGTSPNEQPSQGIVAPSPSQKIKAKIDGIEQEVDIDELTRDYQKYKSSDKRFQEAAQLRKEANEERKLVNDLLSRAEQGDLGWLKGLVPKEKLNKWAEQELLQHIDWEQKPEVERRAILAERRAQELEDRINKDKQSSEQRQAQELEQQAYVAVEKDMVEAIKGLGYDYKITPRFVRRVAEQVYASLEASDDPQAQPIPASVASKHAFEGMKSDASELLSILSPQEIMKMLPQKVRDALRKHDVDQVMSQMPMGIRQSQDKGERKSGKAKKMSTDDRFALLDKKFNRG